MQTYKEQQKPYQYPIILKHLPDTRHRKHRATILSLPIYFNPVFCELVVGDDEIIILVAL